MSDVFVPDATRYPERKDPGVSWRQNLERWLMAWPARARPLWLRRELARLEAGSRGQVSLENLRDRLRLEGLSSDSMSLWYAWVRQGGEGHDLAVGTLALVRGMAVQCNASALQLSMIARASETMVLSGRTVHVLTPDDDTTRHLEIGLQALLKPSALHLAAIMSDCSMSRRREAYRAQVTVLSAREALRDYLGDRVELSRARGEISRKLERLLDRDPSRSARMRGLPFGIVVDGNRSLIEQACEPEVIAGRSGADSARTWAAMALDLASHLEEETHYGVAADGSLNLTPVGLEVLDRLGTGLTGVWCNAYRRNLDVILGLRALRLEPGRHYRVVGQQLEFPAGVAPGDEMLHLLEAREGITVTGHQFIRGKLTYQRFFRRYERLAAVCEDARFIRDELWTTYGLASIDVTPPPSASALRAAPLSVSDERVVRAAMAFGKPVAAQVRQALTAWRSRQNRQAAAKLRRSLLRLDNQLENITAFSGRGE